MCISISYCFIIFKQGDAFCATICVSCSSFLFSRTFDFCHRPHSSERHILLPIQSHKIAFPPVTLFFKKSKAPTSFQNYFGSIEVEMFFGILEFLNKSTWWNQPHSADFPLSSIKRPNTGRIIQAKIWKSNIFQKVFLKDYNTVRNS